MATRAYLRIIIYPLSFQYAFDHKAKECQVSKTYDGNKIRIVNSDDISNLTLNRRKDTAAQYHHNQKG